MNPLSLFLLSSVGLVVNSQSMPQSQPNVRQTQENAAEQTGQPFSIEQFLALYMQNDSDVSLARLQQQLAALHVRQSQDRLRVLGRGNVPVGYELYALPQDQMVHLGSGSVAVAEVNVADPYGGNLNATASGMLLTDPSVKAGGNSASAQVAYSIPLWRNAGGRLYGLQTAYLQQAADASQTQLQAMQLNRCGAGIASYILAYLLQEQATVWQELLQHKERTFKRTAMDYSKKMVTRLDHLTAKADWLAAQQRYRAFSGQRDRAFAVLDTYLHFASEPLLQSPQPMLSELPSEIPEQELLPLLKQHPAVAAVDQEAQSLKAEAVFVGRSYQPEIAIVPQLGAAYMSHLLLGGGTTAPVTNVAAMVGVTLEVPIVQPDKDYQRQKLLTQRQKILRQAQEVLRQLEERARVALTQLATAQAQLEVTQEKLDTIRRQIGEAATMYNSGRLEFQDYLQHWAFYEEVRFEKLDLQYQLWTAQITLLQVLGPAPAICTIEDQQ